MTVSNNDRQIALTGSSITLVAFTSVTGGNPEPTVSWTGPDGQPRTTIGRFDTSIDGLQEGSKASVYTAVVSGQCHSATTCAYKTTT